MKARSVFVSDKKWNSDSISIAFTGTGAMQPRTTKFLRQLNQSIDPLEEELNETTHVPTFIKRVIMERFVPIIGLQINFVDDATTADVRINWGTSDRSTWSYVGIDNLLVQNTTHTMHFAWLDAFTVMHEFMHALGFEHEHQNPNSNPIQYDMDKLTEYMTEMDWTEADVKTNITSMLSVDGNYATQFDPKSIMLYPIDDSLLLSPLDLPFNTKLSMLDIQSIIEAYPGGTISAYTMYKQIHNPTTGVTLIQLTPNEPDDKETYFPVPLPDANDGQQTNKDQEVQEEIVKPHIPTPTSSTGTNKKNNTIYIISISAVVLLLLIIRWRRWKTSHHTIINKK